MKLMRVLIAPCPWVLFWADTRGAWASGRNGACAGGWPAGTAAGRAVARRARLRAL